MLQHRWGPLLFSHNVGVINQLPLMVKSNIVKISRIDGHHVRMARAGLRLSLKELADLSHVSPNTISRIEGGSPAITSTLEALRRTFESEGVIFPDDGSVLLTPEAIARRSNRTG